MEYFLIGICVVVLSCGLKLPFALALRDNLSFVTFRELDGFANPVVATANPHQAEAKKR